MAKQIICSNLRFKLKHMSLLRQFAGQTIIYGIGHILSRVLYFLVLNTYLTYRFDDSLEYGYYGLMYGYATLLIVLLSYRIDTAFFRFGSKEGSLHKTFSSAFFPLIITTICLIGFIIAFSGPISSLLGLPEYPHYFKWFAIILGFDVLSLLPFAKLRLENRAKTFMILRIGNIVLTIILLMFFLEIYLPSHPNGAWLNKIFPELSLDVDYVFISNLIASFSLFVILLFTLRDIKFEIDWSLWKKMVLYASPLIVVGIANSLNQYFSPQLQQYFLEGTTNENISEGGIYMASLRLAALLVMFNTAFNYAAEPFFFRNAANRNDKKIYAKILNLYVICALVMALGLFYYLDIFKYLIGDNFRSGLFVIPILLGAYLMLGIYYNVSIWYKLADKNIYGSVISIIGVFLTLLASSLMLPQIGIVASAWSSLICYSGMVLLAIYFGRKYYPISYDYKKLLSLIGLGVLMVLLAITIDKLEINNYLSLALKSIIYLVFIGYLYKSNQKLLAELKSN